MQVDFYFGLFVYFLDCVQYSHNALVCHLYIYCSVQCILCCTWIVFAIVCDTVEKTGASVHLKATILRKLTIATNGEKLFGF